MTENKQFTFDRDTVAPNIKTPIVFKEGERLSIGEVLDKLNELNNKKEQLAKANKKLKEYDELFFKQVFDILLKYQDLFNREMADEVLEELGIELTRWFE